jgi:predicted nucleic acid-binding protein
MLRFAQTEDDVNKVVSVLAQVEARSAICRLRRENRFTPSEATLVLDALDIETGRMVQQPITTQALEAANSVADRHYLRAMDAIQLGSAIAARDTLPSAPKMRFIASDKSLLEAAKAEGFEIWDPAV